jgi:hypothetical protein
VSVATTVKHSAGGQFVTHAAALPGNPYDGHTLGTVIPQMQAPASARPESCIGPNLCFCPPASEPKKSRQIIRPAIPAVMEAWGSLLGSSFCDERT